MSKARPRRPKKHTNFYGYCSGSEDDDDFATSPPKRTKPSIKKQSDSEDGGKLCGKQTENYREDTNKTSRPSRDEKQIQRDLDCALQASVVTTSSCVETTKPTDMQCAAKDEESTDSTDKENTLPVGEMGDTEVEDSSHGQQSDENKERPVDVGGKQSARKTRPQTLESDEEEDNVNLVESDAEFRASHSSSESDDGDEEDFSSEADSFDVGHANKKKVEKHAKVTKNTTTKSAAGGKGKPRKKETKASVAVAASLEGWSPTRGKKPGQVKNKGDAIAKNQASSTSAGKSKSEVTSMSKSSSSKPQSVRRPAWVPPAKTGQNSLGGVKVTSPCSSIRLGLSRNVRPGQPLHPTARKSQ